MAKELYLVNKIHIRTMIYGSKSNFKNKEMVMIARLLLGLTVSLCLQGQERRQQTKLNKIEKKSLMI